MNIEDCINIPDLQEFINQNIDKNIPDLYLKYSNAALSFDIDFAITQIEARKKNIKKLPLFLSQSCVFADALSAEQATDEAVATFHALIVEDYIKSQKGRKETFDFFDLTAGLGIDFMSISQLPEISKAIAIELNADRGKALKINCKIRKIDKVEIYNENCLDVLDKITPDAIVMIDPARRSSDKKRMYALSDCEPDIVKIYKQIIENASLLLIKCSPMLDISQTIKEIPETTDIYIVDKNGECKEILLVINKKYTAETDNDDRRSDIRTYNAVEITTKIDTTSTFSFSLKENEKPGDISLRESRLLESANEIKCGMYLYTPSPAIMKLSPWKYLCESFPMINKVSSFTNLFVSDIYYDTFPGRILKIDSIPLKKEIKRLKGERFNIVVKNYPIPHQDLIKKLNVKEGGRDFLYAFTAGEQNKSIILIASSI